MSELLSLYLDQLEQPLKIHSRTLDVEFWLVPVACGEQDFDAPVYTLEECRILLALAPSADELRAIHLTKTLFQGELTLSENPDSLRRLYEVLLERYREVAEKLNRREGKAGEVELFQLCRHLSRVLNHLAAIGGIPNGLP